MRCNGRDNTKKLCDFVSIVEEGEGVGRTEICINRNMWEVWSWNVIEGNVSMMTTVTIIMISLTTKIKNKW